MAKCQDCGGRGYQDVYASGEGRQGGVRVTCLGCGGSGAKREETSSNTSWNPPFPKSPPRKAKYTFFIFLMQVILIIPALDAAWCGELDDLNSFSERLIGGMLFFCFAVGVLLLFVFANDEFRKYLTQGQSTGRICFLVILCIGLYIGLRLEFDFVPLFNRIVVVLVAALLLGMLLKKCLPLEWQWSLAYFRIVAVLFCGAAYLLISKVNCTF